MTTIDISIRCNRCGAFRYYTILDTLDSLDQIIEWLRDERFCDECLDPYTGQEDIDFSKS